MVQTLNVLWWDLYLPCPAAEPEGVLPHLLTIWWGCWLSSLVLCLLCFKKSKWETLSSSTVLLEVLGVEIRKAQWTDSPKGLSTSLDSESFQNTISKFQYHFKIPILFQNTSIISKYQYHFKNICTMLGPSQKTSHTPSPSPKAARTFSFLACFPLLCFAVNSPFLAGNSAVKLSRLLRSRCVCYRDPVGSVRTLFPGDLCGFC